MAEHSDHHRITADGWAYRTDDRGLTAYLDPQTRLWQTHVQAISIVRARVALPGPNGPGAPDPTETC
jgi:hypothetical protein